MNPSDVAAALTSLGVSPQDAGLAALGVAAGGYAVTWLAAVLPPPAATTGRFGRFFYAAVQSIAANVGQARNAAGPVPPASK
jgi:hypothetical protein